MSQEVKHRRGSAAQHETFVGGEGEFTYNTDTKRIHAHDGITPGGTPVARADEIAPIGSEGQFQSIVDGKPKYVSMLSVVEGEFIPSITFATPGDLVVSYARRFGHYTRVGKRVFFNIDLSFTPTWTTSSGAFAITGLPLVALGGQIRGFAAAVAFPSRINTGVATDAPTDLSARVLGGSSNIEIGMKKQNGVNVDATIASIGQYLSGGSYALLIEGSYVTP